MNKDTPSHWTTGISDIAPDDIYIRGYPMRSLIGALPFSAITFLMLRGALPSPGQARMMDAILSAILDYGLKKSGTIAARAVVSVNPQMVAGLAAGILGVGEFAVSPEEAGRFVTETHAAWKASGETMADRAHRLVADLRAAKKRVPGFGHPEFRGVDPRAERLKAIAIHEGVWGEVNEWYAAIHAAFRLAANKPDLVLNDVGMLAAIMAGMGFSPPEMAGLAALSTFPGLIAHVSEELQSGAKLRVIADANVEYARQRRDLAQDMKARGWS